MEKNLKLKTIKPRITEKSVRNVSKSNQYTFSVSDNVNKTEIAELIEKTYKVKVLSVKITTIRAKRKSNRVNRKLRIVGGGKKAVVKLNKGDTISEFDLSSKATETKKDKETK